MAFILGESLGKISGLIVLGAGLALAGCETAGYYWQAGAGHLALMRKRVAVEQTLEQPDLDPELRQALTQAMALRAYAEDVLALPVGDSYRHWVDVGAPAVSWNVFAAAELALEPVQWCFPVAGCVSYRGYFARDDARAYAAGLADQGYDVYVGGVSAYSTLGWFDDPLLSTFLGDGDVALAGLLFHELAHQVVYVRGDTTFNESFASAVESLGVAQWLRDRGRDEELLAYLRWRQEREAFLGWLLAQREELAVLYAAAASEEERRAVKAHWFSQLWEEAYPRYRDERGAGATFDHWQRGEWNHARLLSIASYHTWVDAFARLFEGAGCDWSLFYQRVSELARGKERERDAELTALQALQPVACPAVVG